MLLKNFRSWDLEFSFCFIAQNNLYSYGSILLFLVSVASILPGCWWYHGWVFNKTRQALLVQKGNLILQIPQPLFSLCLQGGVTCNWLKIYVGAREKVLICFELWTWGMILAFRNDFWTFSANFLLRQPTFTMGFLCRQNFECEYINVLLNKLLSCVIIQNLIGKQHKSILIISSRISSILSDILRCCIAYNRFPESFVRDRMHVKLKDVQ